MAKDTIKVTSLLPASPHEVYEAWLDSALHARMTGGAATIDKRVGGRHEAWDGYIEGTNVALEPGRRIVQTWRTSDFPADAGDSTIEILLEAEDGQTRITIDHTDIPEGQGKGYESGWRDHYFRPMHEYFSDLAADDAEPVTEAMPIAFVSVYAAASAPPSDEAPTVKLVAPSPKKHRAPAVAAKPSAKSAKKKSSAKKAPPKKSAVQKRAPKKIAKPVATKKKPAKGPAKKTAAKKSAKATTKKAARKPPKKASKSKAGSPKRRR